MLDNIGRNESISDAEVPLSGSQLRFSSIGTPGWNVPDKRTGRE